MSQTTAIKPRMKASEMFDQAIKDGLVQGVGEIFQKGDPSMGTKDRHCAFGILLHYLDGHEACTQLSTTGRAANFELHRLDGIMMQRDGDLPVHSMTNLNDEYDWTFEKFRDYFRKVGE